MIFALGRLGWSLRRIQKSVGVRRETASEYMTRCRVGSCMHDPTRSKVIRTSAIGSELHSEGGTGSCSSGWGTWSSAGLRSHRPSPGCLDSFRWATARTVCYTIADHERVVIGLGDFVAESRCIRERRPEQSACGPTGIVQDPPPFRIGARVEQVGVVSQHTAIVCVSEEEIDVREEEGRDVLRRDHVVQMSVTMMPKNALSKTKFG